MFATKQLQRILIGARFVWLFIALIGVWSLSLQSPGPVLAQSSEPGIDAPALILTDVSGNITVNTTWYTNQSPYRVTGPVTVKPGVTLTIEPGVRVEFAQFQGRWVEGTLNAVGTGSAGLVVLGILLLIIGGVYGIFKRPVALLALFLIALLLASPPGAVNLVRATATAQHEPSTHAWDEFQVMVLGGESHRAEVN